MPWVSIADKHGRRAVLCASLVGNGLTVVAFGTSTNLGTAICTRLAMGVFNGEVHLVAQGSGSLTDPISSGSGAVGVARSAVQDVTDESNRSLAYTVSLALHLRSLRGGSFLNRLLQILGLLWGMGGIVGSVLGGVLEHPVR